MIRPGSHLHNGRWLADPYSKPCNRTPQRLIFIGCALIMLIWHTSLHAKPLNIRNEVADTLVAASSQPHPRLYITTADIQRLKKRIKQPAYRKTWEWILDAAQLYADPGKAYYTANSTGTSSRLPEHAVLRRAIGQLPYMALAFLVTGDEQYLTAAIHWLDKLATRHDWFGNNDMNAALAAFYCVVAYDWLYDHLDADQRKRYRTAVAQHVRHLWQLLQKKEVGWSENLLSNHNYVPAMGIGVAGIALVGEISDAGLWVESAAENFSRVMGYLSPDGASHEGVGYWSTGTAALLMYYLAVEPYLGIEELKQSKFFQNTADFRLHMSLPGFMNNADYGDSPRMDLMGPGYILHALARIFNDGHAQWLGDAIQSARGKLGRGGYFELLWRDDEITPRPPTDLPVNKLFDNLGLFVARDAWDPGSSWSLFKAAPSQGWHAFNMNFYTGSHIHPDSGNFSLWRNGKWLVLDEGYVRKKWTRNHNVYLFNDTGQAGEGGPAFRAKAAKRYQASAKIIYSDIRNDYQYLVADLTKSYLPEAGVELWERTFIVFGSGQVVVRDRIRLKEAGTVQGLIYAPLTAYVIDKQSVCLDEKSGHVLISALPEDWSMDTAPTSIPERERHKHGNYERLQIKQAGRITGEVEIINYISAPRAGCEKGVIPKLIIAGNTLTITLGNERASVEFAARTVKQTNLSD